jgi:hypothetical protein
MKIKLYLLNIDNNKFFKYNYKIMKDYYLRKNFFNQSIIRAIFKLNYKDSSLKKKILDILNLIKLTKYDCDLKIIPTPILLEKDRNQYNEKYKELLYFKYKYVTENIGHMVNLILSNNKNLNSFNSFYNNKMNINKSLNILINLKIKIKLFYY